MKMKNIKNNETREGEGDRSQEFISWDGKKRVGGNDGYKVKKKKEKKKVGTLIERLSDILLT